MMDESTSNIIFDIGLNLDSQGLNRNACRICLEDKATLDWNANIVDFCELSYKDCYYKYTQLEETDSNCYPTNLCEVCSIELQNAHLLFEKAMDSFCILQEVLATELENNSKIQISGSIPTNKGEAQPFDGENISLDVKSTQLNRHEKIFKIKDGVSVSNKVSMEEYVNIESLESSVDLPLDQALDQICDIELSTSFPNNKSKKLDTQLREICDTTVSISTTTKTIGRRKRIKSFESPTEQESIEECCNEVLKPSVTKKTIDKRNKFKSLTVTPSEQSPAEIWKKKSPLTTTQASKRKRKKNILMCAYCSVKVNGSDHLKQHEATHNENRKRTEICPKCGIKLYTKLSLSQHVKTHDKNRERKYKCEFCEKAFFYRGTLNVHRRIHLGLMVICQICSKQFCRQIDLDNHLLKHSVAPLKKNFVKKRYVVQCQYCDKSIPTNRWRDHVAVHLDQPQMKCKICDRSFFSRQNCINHLRRFHLKNSNEYDELIHYLVDRKVRTSILIMKQQLNVQPVDENFL